MSDQISERPTIRQRLRWRAVLLGFCVDYAGSTGFGLIVGIIGGIAHASEGGSPASAQEALFSSPSVLRVMMTVGLLFVVLGGFVAARLAPQARYLNAAALGVIDVFLGFTALFHGLPAWYLAISFPATIPCALLGGFLAGLFADRAKAP